jgi:hypothetical protein
MLIKVARQNLIGRIIRKAEHLSNNISPLVQSITTRGAFNICSQALLIKISFYNFVNIPISSKYYHAVFPTEIDLCMKLAREEKILNEKILILQHIVEVIIKDPKYIRYDL